MWRAGATALRRATGSLQYFPYTDLTAPSENAKNWGRVVFDRSAAGSDVPGDLVRRRDLRPEGLAWRSEIHPSERQRRVYG
jgi:hypothetical protein